MSRFDDEEYGDDDYYDGEEEDDPDYYINLIRGKLDKGAKIGDEAIIAQLELYDYDVDKALKAIKAQLKPKTAPSTGGNKPPGNTSKSTPASNKPAGGSGKTVATSAIPSSKVTPGTGKANNETVETTTLPSKSNHSSETSHHHSHTLPSRITVEELHISDDELTENSAKPAANGGGDSHHKPELTLVVVGHVDAGKSTLVGNLLRKLGKVAQRTMHKYEKDSAAIGKASFSLAWVMDERQAERERGVTIDIAER